MRRGVTYAILISEVGIGSRSHDLVGDDFRILRMSSSDTGSKEDRALLFMLALVIETGTDDCSALLIFMILSQKSMRSISTICCLFLLSMSSSKARTSRDHFFHFFVSRL